MRRAVRAETVSAWGPMALSGFDISCGNWRKSKTPEHLGIGSEHTANIEYLEETHWPACSFGLSLRTSRNVVFTKSRVEHNNRRHIRPATGATFECVWPALVEQPRLSSSAQTTRFPPP